MIDEKVNPWLAERLKRIGVDPEISILLEVDRRYLDQVLSNLRRLGISVDLSKISTFPASAFIPVVIDSALIDAVSKIPGVIKVHYNAPVWIKPFFLEDSLLGKLVVSKVEIPGLPTHVAVTLAFAPLIAGSKVARNNVEIYTSDAVLRVMRVPSEYPAPDFKIAVIDTGATIFHPQLARKQVVARSMVPEPAVVDFLGHGTWVATAIAGSPVRTRFGVVRGVIDRASNIVSIKGLAGTGFGSAGGILKAMEEAWKLGAKVINMSLGGPLQGRVDDDPMCRVVEQLAKAGVLCVVAAGNEGPEEWTIGSPGASPYALTVGAYSLTDDAVSYWSSRGPSGEFYKENRDLFEDGLEKYGDNLVKPDIIAPGGGREREEKIDEVLYSGCTGLFDGYYDLLPDLYEGMHGTSMATPIATGLVSILLAAGKIRNVEDVKEAMRKREKSYVEGYGLIHTLYFT